MENKQDPVGHHIVQSHGGQRGSAQQQASVNNSHRAILILSRFNSVHHGTDLQLAITLSSHTVDSEVQHSNKPR